MKLFYSLIILVLLQSCSFDNKSGIWKNDNNIYSMFTNVIFESEKKAIEFKDKQKSMRKKHDCRAVKYEYKYFNGVNEDEIN